jgi:hypothetical protein
MRKIGSERGKQVANRRGGGGKWVKNREKILNRGNEPKNVLKTQELACSGAENELAFERKKAQTKRKMWRKSTNCGDPSSSVKCCLVMWAYVIPPPRATDPSPGPPRLVKAPVAVHPLPCGEGKDPFASTAFPKLWVAVFAYTCLG